VRMASQFDPVPACFCGVEFLPIPRLERIVSERIRKFEHVTKQKAEFPIDIETIVEVVESIHVDYFGETSEFDSDVLGVYDFSNKKMYIRESIDNNGRRRFTWAHEYGHVVLHSGHFLQQVFDFFEDANDGAVQLHRGQTDTRNMLEWQANQFASHMLMPTRLVRDAFDQVRHTLSANQLISQLATVAEVSIQASRIRLEQIGWVEKARF